MKIRSLMIPDPITIGPSASIMEAIELMKVNSIRHLPVVKENNTLVGFVTLSDLKQSLIPAMVGDIELKDIIIQEPITVRPDDDIEIAAQLIYKHKIGGMPVVSNGKLMGIITGTDILRAFIDMMGILTASSRIDVMVEDKPSVFQNVLEIIVRNGGEIINVGMTSRKNNQKEYYFRLSACKTAAIKASLEREGIQVLNAMD
jgi:acetoin utilization protein AcuB